MRARQLAALALILSSCVGTTGGEVIEFRAAASGPADAVAGQPYVFTSGLGWNVSLTKAILHVGAIYLSRSMPVSGAQNTDCILPTTTYVGQVVPALGGDGLDVDLLSPEAQPFPNLGEGFTDPPAIVGQVWLTHVRIDHTDDTKPILQVEGSAEKDGALRHFTGKLTIGSNRVATSSTQSGADSICKERIATPISTYIALQKAGQLLLRIDPRRLFSNVDFASPTPEGDFAFSDAASPQDQASRNLYASLKSASGTVDPLYSFVWAP